MDLADVTGASGAGRHPLPTREQFEYEMRKAGVNRGSRVVVYDDAGGSVASRLWWLLRVHGLSDVAVLDGGLQAWGSDLDVGDPPVLQGDFEASDPDLSAVVSFDDVSAVGDAVLLDVRAPERYRGELEPIDPVAGHVPGAKNAFWQRTLMGEDGKLLPPDKLREAFAKLGVVDGNAVVYCGSGVVACQTLLALEQAGIKDARLYSGGWSDWSTRDGAPVATDDE